MPNWMKVLVKWIEGYHRISYQSPDKQHPLVNKGMGLEQHVETYRIVNIIYLFIPPPLHNLFSDKGWNLNLFFQQNSLRDHKGIRRWSQDKKSSTCSDWGQERKWVSPGGWPTSTSGLSLAPPANSTPTCAPGPEDWAPQTLKRSQCGMCAMLSADMSNILAFLFFFAVDLYSFFFLLILEQFFWGKRRV